MKDRIKFKISLLIYYTMVELTSLIKGKKKRAAFLENFFSFLNIKNGINHNLYKIRNNDLLFLNNALLKNQAILIEELQKQKLRSPKQKSINRLTAIGDDTSDGDKKSKQSKRKYKSYDNSTKQKVMGHTFVFLALTIGMGKNCKKLILDYRLWHKNAKTKHELFLDMMYKLKEKIEQNNCDFLDLVVTFDSGYSYDDVLNSLNTMGFKFVGKYHHRKKVTINGVQEVLTTWLRNRFWAKDFKTVSEKYKESIRCKYYKEVTIEDYEWSFYLCLFERKGHKRRPRRLLVTNLKKAYFTVLERYSQRFYIEQIFKELKQYFRFKKLNKSDTNKNLEVHILTCIARYDFIQKVKWENRLSKRTTGEVINMIRKWVLLMPEKQREKWFSYCLTGDFEFYKFKQEKF